MISNFKKLEISIDVVFYEHLILKYCVAIDMSSYEEETSSTQVIQVDVDPPLVNNMQVMPEPKEN